MSLIESKPLQGPGEGAPDSRRIARRYRAGTCAAVTAPIVFSSGRGSRIRDAEGNEYLDFIGGYGVVNTGWQHPEVLSAVRRQMERSCFAPPWFPTAEATVLAEELLAVTMGEHAGDYKVARATGGADANEAVLRALRARDPARARVLCTSRAYHGGTAATLALSDTEAFSLPLAPAPQPRVPAAYCFRCAWGLEHPACGLACAGAVDRALSEDPTIGAVILEPVLGSGGVIVPPPGYLARVREICDRRGVLLVLDEVLTGMGRLGSMLACHAARVLPDAVALGKGLSAGYVPIGAAILRRDLAAALESREDVSPTFAWTPLACAAALANVRLVAREGLCARSASLGDRLRTAVRRVFEERLAEHVGDVRGAGLMVGVELVRDRAGREPSPQLARRLALACKRRGLIIGTSWDWHILVLMPALSISEQELEEGIALLAAAADDVAARARTATPEACLRPLHEGPPEPVITSSGPRSSAGRTCASLPPPTG